MKLFGFEIKRTTATLSNRAPRQMQIRIGRGGRVSTYDRNIDLYIQRGYQDCPVVNAIVNATAQAAARAKWCVKNKNGDEIDVNLLNSGDKPILQMANPAYSWSGFIANAVTHEMLEGNLFISGEKLESGKFISLSVYPTDGMHIHGDVEKNFIEHYQIDFNWDSNLIIPADEMLHISNPNPDWRDPNSLLFGQSIFEAARVPIETYNESMEAGLYFLGNKGADKVLFNKSEEMELGIEGEEALNDSLRSKVQGTQNTGNNLTIIDGADLGVLDVSSNAADALVLEQRIQAAKEICNVASFPAALMGINDATYQNAKEAKKAFWENCVMPRLDKIKDGLNTFLTPTYGKDIYLDYSLDHIDAIQEDRLMRGKAIKEFAGMISINEARTMAGLKPMPEGGDELYVGFVQAVVSDQQELSSQNGVNEEQE